MRWPSYPPRVARSILDRKGEWLGRCIYSRTGHLLFEVVQGRTGIWAVPFSLGRLEATGQPYLLDASGVGEGQLSASADGTLAYLAAREEPDRLVWFNRKGEELGAIETPHRQMNGPSLSPEGRRVAITVWDALGSSVWIYDLERSTRTRLTQGRDDIAMFWRGPDHVVFGRRREGSTAGSSSRCLRTAQATNVCSSRMRTLRA